MLAGGAYIFIALCFGLAGGLIGRMKGSSFFIWFLVSALIPFIGLLCAVLYRNEDVTPPSPPYHNRNFDRWNGPAEDVNDPDL